MVAPKHDVYLPEPLIKQIANSMVGHYGLTSSDREDIEQFLRKRLVEAWRNYDPSRGRPNTFADRVVDAAASVFLRDRTREKRNPLRIQGTLESCGYEPVTDRHDEDRLVLKMDVDIVLDVLEPDDRKYALLIMDHGLARAADLAGLTERKAQAARRRIFKVFTERGLDRYVTQRWERN